MAEYCGAWRQGSPEQWVLTTDIDKFLDIPSEDKLFVSSLQELLAKVEEKEPPPHYFTTYWQVLRQNGTELLQKQNTLLLRTTDCSLIDLHELAEVVKQYGPLCYQNDLTKTYSVPSNILNTRILESFDPLVVNLVADYASLRYSPNLSKKKIAAAKRRASEKPIVKKDDFYPLTHAFRALIYQWLGYAYDPTGSWYGITNTIKRQIHYMELLFGKHSYRRVKEFQEICRLWARNGKETKRRLLMRMTSHGGVNEKIIGFFNWMDKECREPLPRVKKKFKAPFWRKFPLGKLTAKKTAGAGHNT